MRALLFSAVFFASAGGEFFFPHRACGVGFVDAQGAIDDLAGSYYKGTAFTETRLDIDRSGHFSFSWSTDDGQITNCGGTAILEGTRLFLMPRGIEAERTLRRWIALRGLATKRGPVKEDTALEAPTRLYLYPVRWGRRVYLLRPDEVLGFCNAANLGLEPRPEEADGSFLVRAIMTARAAAGVERPHLEAAHGLPRIPHDWDRYLLRSSLRGRVLEMTKSGRAWIDVGSRQGLHKGMRVMLAVEGSGLGSAPVEVIESEDVKSLIQAAGRRFPRGLSPDGPIIVEPCCGTRGR
jgi:hypothetical protein